MREKTSVTIVVLNILVLFIATNICQAQSFHRKKKGEIFAAVQFMNGDETCSGPVTLELDDTMAYGFGLGYNLDNHFNVNTDFLFGSADYDISSFWGGTVTGDANVFIWDVNLDYYFLEDTFTPLVTAGIGFINFDGDMMGDSFDETDFSYNAGIGLRWDITENLFLKAMYRWLWTEMEDADDTLLLDGVTVNIGFMF